MKNISTTMKMNLVFLKSHFLLKMFQHLPDEKLRKILISPRAEFIRSVKSRIRYSLDEIGEC